MFFAFCFCLQSFRARRFAVRVCLKNFHAVMTFPPKTNAMRLKNICGLSNAPFGARLLFLLLSAAVFSGAFAHVLRADGAEGARLKRILLVDSYANPDIWSMNLARGIRKSVNLNGLPAGIESYELAVRYQPGGVPSEKEIETLRARLADGRYDLVIAQNNAAADLFLNGTLKTSGGAPVLVSAYQGPLHEKIPEGMNLTGLETPVNMYDNIILGCRLLPKNKVVFVVMEGAADGRAQLGLLEKWKRGSHVLDGMDVRIISGEQYSTVEALKIVSGGPRESFMIFLSWSSAKDVYSENSYTMLAKVRQAYPGLILGKYAGYMDVGSAGGTVVDGLKQGGLAGELAARILRGERADAIKARVARGVIQTVFEYPDLARAGVNLSAVPEDAVLLNEPEGFLHRHIYAALGVAAALILAMVAVVVRQVAGRAAMRKIEGMFANLPQNIAVVDCSGKILYSHMPSVKSAAYFPTKSLRDLPEFGEDFDTAIKRTFETGKRHGIDFKNNGEDRHAEIIPIPESLFGVKAAMWISSDQTELRQAHLNLALIAERFRLTLESIGDAVISTDTDGLVTLMNPVAERLTGVPFEEAKGRPHEEVFRIVSYLDGNAVESPIRRAVSSGKTVELANHTDLLSKDGRRYHIADSAAPIRNPKGEITGGVLVFRDVTEEYSKRDQLNAALTNLEYALELTRSASFRLNEKTRVITGNKILPELWAVKNGTAIPREEFVYREDLDNYIRNCGELLSRKRDTATWNYRSIFTGELRYYRMMASMDWEGPDAPHMFGVIQDITDITRSVNRLKENTELWEMVIDSIPIYFFVKDADNDFRYMLCNAATADMLGKSRDEIRGKTDAEIFPRLADADAFKKRDEDAMEKTDGEEFEEVLMDAEGKILHCKTIKKPFIGSNGRRMLIGASMNVSEMTHIIECERFNSDVLAYAAGEPDFDKVVEHIADSLRKQMGGDRILLARCNADGLLRLDREWMAAGVGPIGDERIAKYHELWDKYVGIMRGRRIVKIPDMRKSPFTSSLNLDGSYQTLSLIVAPIFEGDRLWGALFVSYALRSRDFSEADEVIMRSCANVISIALERKKQEDRIRSYEREMHLILNNIDIPISLHDAGGKLLHVNSAVCRMTGLSTPALLSAPQSEVFYMGTVPPPDSPLKRIMAGETSASATFHANNREYIIHADAVIDDGGRLINIVKSATDITELNALIKNQELLNFCLETLFMEEDAQKAVFAVLEAICRHFGASRGHILKFDMEAGKASVFAEYLESGGNAMFAGEPSVPFDLSDPWILRLKSREPVLIYDLGNPDEAAVFGSWTRYVDGFDMRSIFASGICQNEEFWGVLGVIYEGRQSRRFNDSDIEILKASAHLIEIMLARQEVRDRLIQALEQARAADKAKSFFIASVSHEIRTPLNAIIGFSELLQAGDVSHEEQKEYLGNISYSGSSLLQLINDVLDLSKLEAEQMDIVPIPTDFELLCRDIMKVFSFRAAERGLELKIEISQMPELELDQQRIRQILFNFIGNAVKFTDSGSITLAADFNPSDESTGTLKIRVIDTGSGIAKEDQMRLMEPFVQLPNARGVNAVNSSTGLGLPISKRLAEKMGGALWIESEVGKGSVFGVTLGNVKYRAGRTERGALSCSVAQTGDSELSVLIVDDVDMNLKVLKAICAKIGIADVVTAASGAEALDALERRGFDFVMTDMWMPVMDGVELLTRMRADKRFEKLPVIVVTADADARDRSVLKDFNGVLLKPITIEKVRELVESVKLPATV